jgi:hypothetical protein
LVAAEGRAAYCPFTADHGLTPIDVEHVLNKLDRHDRSRSSGLPIVFGRTPSGERIAVVYEEIDEDMARSKKTATNAENPH